MAGEMRKRTSEQAECPVCGATLQGSRFSGYSCTTCGSHFSGRFMMHLRKREFKSRIAAHFGVATPEASPSPGEPSSVPSASQETQEFIIKDDGRIQETIERLHEVVHGVVGEVDRGVQQLENVPLEEILGGATEVVPDAPPEQKPAVLQAGLRPLKRASRLSPAKSAAKRRAAKPAAKRSAARKLAARKPAAKSSAARPARHSATTSARKTRAKARTPPPLRKRSSGKPSPVKRKRPR